MTAHAVPQGGVVELDLCHLMPFANSRDRVRASIRAHARSAQPRQPLGGWGNSPDCLETRMHQELTLLGPSAPAGTSTGVEPLEVLLGAAVQRVFELRLHERG